MPLSLLVLGVIILLVAAYFLYGTRIARQYALDDARVTPATEKADGVDFVPTRPFYLLGQHFSAIAAAGPIVGPIAACVVFGWGPCLIWIALGVVFIGAVHDFSALVASVRHGAHSIAEIARRHLGRRAWVTLVAFIWIALIYIIVAFTDVTAQTFRGLSAELLAAPGAFNKGGAVAAASGMYMLLALVMGVVQRFTRTPLWALTLVFVPATLGVVYLGTRIDHLLNFTATTWYVVILVYCFVASLLPMWLLQQPRGFLGGFILYLAIGVGLVGTLFGGFEIKQAAFKPVASYGAFFTGANGAPRATELIFPFLFVTIACGACSGFHGLICGGTTSRQVQRESHCKPVAFGAMLLEGLVAVIALATVVIVADGDRAGRTPGVLYGDGLALFITRFVDPNAVRSGEWATSPVFAMAATFGAMAFSTFVFDTLDVTTRLGRYLLCELSGLRGRVAGVFAAGLTAGVPLLVLFAPTTANAGAASPPTYMLFWTLFGTANQLLAALTLLGICIWLRKQGRGIAFVFVPMLFVMGVTLSALAIQIYSGVRSLVRVGSHPGGATWREWLSPEALNAGVATALLALALIFIVDGWRATRSSVAAVAA